jgi:hypothetical protein
MSVELPVVFAVTLALIGAGVLAMAVGVIFRRPCLRGSCGGPDAGMRGGERLSCAACPNRKHERQMERPA